MRRQHRDSHGLHVLTLWRSPSSSSQSSTSGDISPPSDPIAATPPMPELQLDPTNSWLFQLPLAYAAQPPPFWPANK
ncbi:hypothetical protein M407DRAFT_117577 [Tulasnella calospora MUT 4182]|uniref:Uncharacterized protein n=1 Tax=Tulasnella calospora MUT 4182 TaxID=1051891 RepID=A0A0C3Q281_9AGAM|nr:hypothetical protein M407DRAFT_117577 [Tulasnella calospora MUT 4182]